MFEHFIGIDYSGEGTSSQRLPGLQVFRSRARGLPEKLWSPTNGARNWTRKEIAQYLLTEARGGARFLAGIDHCFSFPKSYFHRYERQQLTSWPAFLEDFTRHWPLHEDGYSVKQLRALMDEQAAEATRCGQSGEFRLCERWTSSAKCVFQFGMQGSVAHSSHACIPWRYGRGNRSPDEHDAYSTARWMSDMQERDALEQYFSPPLSDEERAVARLEGWILGIR